HACAEEGRVAPEGAGGWRCSRESAFGGDGSPRSGWNRRGVPGHAGDTAQPEHLPERIRKRQNLQTNPAPEPTTGNLSEWPTLDTLQQDYVRRVMAAGDGNKRRAAQVARSNRRTRSRWLASGMDSSED